MKNIIMIVTDQHRQDSLKMYGESIVETPNLDLLALNGVVFDNCYTSCPVCTPARSSFQLGLYPSKTGFETNSFEIGSRSHMLPDVEFSLSRRLGKCGYKTGYTGKWHLGLKKDKNSVEGKWLMDDYKNYNMSIHNYLNIGSVPSDHGYVGDDFEGHGVGGYRSDEYLNYLEENNKKLVIKDVVSGTRKGDHTTTGIITSGLDTTVEHFLINRSKQIISSFKGEKFYFQLNFWGPHEPFYPPIEFYKKYENVKIGQWESFNDVSYKINDVLRRYDKQWDFFNNSLRHYYAYIEYIDYEIGNLINYLKKEGLYDNTVIIFTSDHGDYQGSHGHMENKSYGLYDETTKVPLIIKDGENIGRKKELVGTCDIYQTILDYAGEDLTRYDLDGESIKKIFDGEKWDNRIITESTCAFPLIVTQRMFRIDNLKYIFIFGSQEHIYDLDLDKNELNNLASDEVLLTKMRKLCYHKLVDNKDPIKDMYAKVFKLGEYS